MYDNSCQSLSAQDLLYMYFMCEYGIYMYVHILYPQALSTATFSGLIIDKNSEAYLESQTRHLSSSIGDCVKKKFVKKVGTSEAICSPRYPLFLTMFFFHTSPCNSINVLTGLIRSVSWLCVNRFSELLCTSAIVNILKF